MKKLIVVSLILALILPVAAPAENQFSEYTVDQLYLILNDVRKEILQKSQWDEVTVPPGYYVIGEDIPVGHWTIKYSTGEVSLIEYFKNPDSTGIMPADSLSDYESWAIGDPDNSLSSIYDKKEIDLQLTDGYHLNISVGSVIFVPFTGRQSPFFK